MHRQANVKKKPELVHTNFSIKITITIRYLSYLFKNLFNRKNKTKKNPPLIKSLSLDTHGYHIVD